MVDPNRALFESVVRPLAPVLDDLVFVGACTTARALDLTEHRVRVVTPPLFVATKLEAFRGRGRERRVIRIRIPSFAASALGP